MSGQLRAVAVVIAVAVIVFFVYRNHRHNLAANTGDASISVLVAKTTIQKGTTGAAIRQAHLYKVANIPQDQIRRSGAIFDPSALAGKKALLTGKAAVKDIPAGQPLTMGDFAPFHPPVWTPRARAVVIKPASSTLGRIVAGSYVDVWVAGDGHGSHTPHSLYRNLEVLAVSTGNGTITLRAMAQQVGRLISASANDRLIVRPHQ